MRHSTTGKGRAVATLAAAVLLCGIAGTWPAAAQDRGPAFGDPDRQHGHRRRSVGPDERRPDLDRLGHEEFERGYRAGREDERQRDDRSGALGRFAGPGWTTRGRASRGSSSNGPRRGCGRRSCSCTASRPGGGWTRRWSRRGRR